MHALALNHQGPPSLGNALGWSGAGVDPPSPARSGYQAGGGGDALDQFAVIHSPRPMGQTPPRTDGSNYGTTRGGGGVNLLQAHVAGSGNPLTQGPFDNGPAPARRMSREGVSKNHPLRIEPGHFKFEDPFRDQRAREDKAREDLARAEMEGYNPTPRGTPRRRGRGEPEPERRDAQGRLPGQGPSEAEQMQIDADLQAGERRRGAEMKREQRRHRDILDMIRLKIEAKNKKLTDAFRRFDENSDGVVSYAEFRTGLINMGIELSDADFIMLVEKVDVDGEGTVDYTEFAEVLKTPDIDIREHRRKKRGGGGGGPQGDQSGGARGGVHVDPLTGQLPVAVTAQSRSVAKAEAKRNEADRQREADARREQRRHRDILDSIRIKIELKNKRLTDAFRRFDENCDGVVSYSEFRTGLNNLGIELSDDDFIMLVSKVDVDGEGTVDYTEFAEVLRTPDVDIRELRRRQGDRKHKGGAGGGLGAGWQKVGAFGGGGGGEGPLGGGPLGSDGPQQGMQQSMMN